MRLTILIIATMLMSSCIKERHLEDPEFLKLSPQTQSEIAAYINQLQGITFDKLGFTERWRPQYHLTPAFGTMGKPESLTYYKGVWHLFYQHNAQQLAIKGGWGHAISKDLVHWKLLPIALLPDSLGSINSGKVIGDLSNTSGFFQNEGGLVAVYSQSKDSITYINTATSIDGIYWHKSPHKTILKSTATVQNFFWHKATRKWIMIVGHEKSSYIYHSGNLTTWEKKGLLYEGDDIANLNFFELPVEDLNGGTKWILSTNNNDALIGEFDGFRFYPEHSIGMFSHGIDLQNMSIYGYSNQPNVGTVVMHILNGHVEKGPTTSPWLGASSLPRELFLRYNSEQEPSIVQVPTSQIVELHREQILIDSFLVTAEPINMRSKHLLGNLLELNINFIPGKGAVFKVEVLKGEHEKTVIAYDEANEQLVLDISQSGAGITSGQPLRFETTLKPTNEIVELRLFVDVSVVEVFDAQGTVMLSASVFPSPLSQEIEISSVGANSSVNAIEAFQMFSMWKEEFYRIQRTIASRPEIVLKQHQSTTLEAGVFPYYLSPDSIQWFMQDESLANISANFKGDKATITALKAGTTQLIVDSHAGARDTVRLVILP